jgi:hypothetical protein
MSSARLEVIRDDATVAPHMSRGMPAALDGLVTQVAFDAFCDRLDALFALLDAEQKRHRRSFWWIYITIYLWFMYFLFFIPIFKLKYIQYSAPAFFVHIVLVGFCTARPTGAMTDKELLHLIRCECDEMTRQTPFVSFHTILMPVPSVARGAALQVDTVDHIGVSVSMLATASSAAVAVLENAMDLTKRAEAASSDEGHPVVYAQAVASRGDYRPVHVDVEMV